MIHFVEDYLLLTVIFNFPVHSSQVPHVSSIDLLLLNSLSSSSMPFRLPFSSFCFAAVGRLCVLSLRGNSRRASPGLTLYFQIKAQQKDKDPDGLDRANGRQMEGGKGVRDKGKEREMRKEC